MKRPMHCRLLTKLIRWGLAVIIAPKINFSLEESMEYILKDEYLEVTPNSMRIRKIYLDENDRKRYENKAESAQ